MVEYFDSFGVCPPAEIECYLKTSNKAKLAYNATQYQKLSSILCGWYCMLFIYERWRGTSPHEIFSWKLDEKMIKSYKPFHKVAACGWH
jgi:hypothetical protein